MNTITLTMISFIIGVCFAMNVYSVNYIHKTTTEAAIVAAYNMGKAKCPMDNVCMNAAKYDTLKPMPATAFNYGDMR